MRRLRRILRWGVVGVCVLGMVEAGAGMVWRSAVVVYPRGMAQTGASEVGSAWRRTRLAVVVKGGFVFVATSTNAERLVVDPRDGTLYEMTSEKGMIRVFWNRWGFGCWVQEYRHPPAIRRDIRVPLWAVLAAFGVMGVVAARPWRLIRRRRDPEAVPCARCGYDLRGSPGRCPECGAERV
jgi:hypothetical protein